jgi:hypothetical protein
LSIEAGFDAICFRNRGNDRRSGDGLLPTFFRRYAFAVSAWYCGIGPSAADHSWVAFTPDLSIATATRVVGAGRTGQSANKSRLQFGRGAQHGEKALLAFAASCRNHLVSNRQEEKMAHAGISGTRTKSVLSDPGLSHRTLFRAPNLSSPF